MISTFGRQGGKKMQATAPVEATHTSKSCSHAAGYRIGKHRPGETTRIQSVSRRPAGVG